MSTCLYKDKYIVYLLTYYSYYVCQIKYAFLNPAIFIIIIEIISISGQDILILDCKKRTVENRHQSIYIFFCFQVFLVILCFAQIWNLFIKMPHSANTFVKATTGLGIHLINQRYLSFKRLYTNIQRPQHLTHKPKGR